MQYLKMNWIDYKKLFTDYSLIKKVFTDYSLIKKHLQIFIDKKTFTDIHL